MIGRFLSFVFHAILWLLCAPFRAIYWIFTEGMDHGLDLLDAMSSQWRVDKSIFFAKMLVTLLVLFLTYKAVVAVHLLFHAVK